jgi:membrane fusion protein, heavy metal efflux system
MRTVLRWRRTLVWSSILVAIGVGVFALVANMAANGAKPHPESDQKQVQSTETGTFRPTDAQWASLTVEPVGQQQFRSILTTDGKIAVNDDRATPVFSPYAGRVIRLFAKAGDRIEQGQPLFTIEAADMVQAQNDFFAAVAGLNKARSLLQVSEIAYKRHKALLQGNAVARKDYEQAEATFIGAENDVRASEAVLQATRNRLRILGKSDAEISAFERDGRISAETLIPSPLTGTVVQRKVGPGQFVTNGSNDPVFVVGDLSTVWLIANIRESDATKIGLDQVMEFTLLAAPDQIFRTKINYIAAVVNSDTRRLQVRAEIPNAEGILKPEMFASVTIVIGAQGASPSVPRHALVYEGEVVRVWVARDDKSLELRQVKVGLTNGNQVQVLEGLRVGEKIVTQGSLFIDRLVRQNH